MASASGNYNQSNGGVENSYPYGLQRLAIFAGVISLFIGIACCGFSVWLLQRATGSLSGGKSNFAVRGVRDGQFEFQLRSVNCGETRIRDPKYYGSSEGHVSEAADASSTTDPTEVSGPDVIIANGQFCMVTIHIRNIGNQPRIMALRNQTAYDSNGVEYAPDGAASDAANKKRDTFPELLRSGERMVGVLVFDIPVEASLDEIELHDSPLSKGVSLPV